MGRDPETKKFTKQPYREDVGPQRIESIQFSTLSRTEIQKLSEVQVWQGSYYIDDAKPVDGGLLDPHMGPPNKSGKCETCCGNFNNCPGHWGHVHLDLPVYNVGYLSTIVDIMTCICKKCSMILLDEKEQQHFLKKMRHPDPFKKNEILKEIVKKCKAMGERPLGVMCSECRYINGMVQRTPLGILHDRANIADSTLGECQAEIIAASKKRPRPLPPPMLNLSSALDARLAYELLRKMRDQDCELLYLNGRPENLMMTNILVPPTAIRPSVVVDGSRTCSFENDISERLNLIIQANASLRSEITKTESPRLLDSWKLLQEFGAQYINSDVCMLSKQSESSSRPLSGFVQRLKGKQGRLCGNLLEKHVEYTGRTVISPDPNLKITEVGIPIFMAQFLTYPERVSPHNIEKLRRCVRNGYKYPGASSLWTPDGDEILLRYKSRERHADQLRCGSIVNRHLEDGDVVLLNRQPSLHRMSIMSYRARIMPWRTLRFNASACNPYNAHFDGQEMNIHVPQTEEARTEALVLMGVQNNLCTPKNGEILIASTQDILTSSFLITRKDTFYDRSAFALLCSYIGDAMDPIDLPTPALVKPVELWTGKQLFSVLLRPHANVRVYINLTVAEKNYQKSKETMCPKDGFVYIRNSELVSGQLGKAALGNGNKDGIYSVLLTDYGPHAAATCMTRLAKLSARWIGNHGFSIGIDDVQSGDTLNKEKKAILKKGYDRCDNLKKSYTSGHLEWLPGCNYAETLEAKITGRLDNIRETTTQVCMKNLNWRNSPLIMSQCGSKGSPNNICQMIACVGQQSVGGRRAPNGFLDRTLPHFEREAKDPDAKGFVQNSFYAGLSATEFFFNSMEGRESLVDIVVKPAETGYISRRLMKAMEDLSISYDYTVRNASGCIVQFMYGNDAMDPAQMEEKSGLPLNFERLFMKAKATCPAKEMQKILTTEEIKEIVNETIEKRLLKSSITLGGKHPETYPSLDAPPKDGCLETFADSLKNFIEKNCPSSVLKLSEGDGCYQENAASYISEITLQQLMVFLETCISRLHSKILEAGTAIGAIGAQSIGERGTQMPSLKTSQFAGVASMNVALGVPRMKEIITAAKTIKTPIIIAALEEDNNDKKAKIVKGHIKRILLEKVAESIELKETSKSKPFIKIVLDMEKIYSAELPIRAKTIKKSILSSNLELLEKDIQYLYDTISVSIYPERRIPHLGHHMLMQKLPKVVVQEIKTVKRVTIIDEAKQNDHKRLKLAVEGTGLLSVMSTEGVDSSKTRSNHILEVQHCLGIEAARRVIIEELQESMSSLGMTIDIRHLMLLADIMTFEGEVLGLTNHGLQRMGDSVLGLSSFQKTADHLFKASVNGRVDEILGVRECIMMGIPMRIGTTGMFKVRTSVPLEFTYGPDPII